MYRYALNDVKGLATYTRRSVRFVGLVMALPIGLICGFSKPLLTLWLGQDFAHLSGLMSLMTIHLCVNLGVMPLFGIQLTTNRVCLPGIVTCLMGFMNLGLALLLAVPAGWGMYGVAAAGAIMLTLKNCLFTPIYGARILYLKWYTFMVDLLPIVSGTFGVVIASRAFLEFINIDDWFLLIFFSFVICCIYILIVWLLLSNEDRDMVQQKASWVLKKAESVCGSL